MTSPARTPSLADCRRAVQDRLVRVRRRLRGQLLLEGIAWGVGAAVLLAALSLAVDRLLRPELTVRLALLTLAALALASAAVFFYLRPAPALTERDTVLLADFVNTTGEVVFDGTLSARGMPAWSGKLGADDVEAIRAYIVDRARVLRDDESAQTAAKK